MAQIIGTETLTQTLSILQNGKWARTSLSDLIPPRVGDVSNYPVRNSDHYVSVNANTTLYANSILPSTIKAWNNLPASIKSANTIGSFKTSFNKEYPKSPRLLLWWGETLSNSTYSPPNWVQLLKPTSIPTEPGAISKLYLWRNRKQYSFSFSLFKI